MTSARRSRRRTTLPTFSPAGRTARRSASGRGRTRVFSCPRAEIAGNGYDLSINRYKEVEYEAVEYAPPKVILGTASGVGGGHREGT